VVAIHEASTTLTTIAAADYERIRVARTGRLLVPAISTEKGRHAGGPFARATKNQGETLLGAYSQVGTTSVKAAAKTAALIEVAARHDTRRPAMAEIQVERHMPGPVERRLLELGVTSPGLLERGATIDLSARELIDEAA